MKKKLIAAILCLSMVISLAACSSARNNAVKPEAEIVAADDVESTPAPEDTTQAEEEDISKENNIIKQFSSDDGTIVYNFYADLDGSEIDDIQTKVKVRPHEFSSEEARFIAETLLPDCRFYEDDPARVQTKSEIQKEIDVLKEYTSKEALSKLFSPESSSKVTIPAIEAAIDNYNAQLPFAPETGERGDCQWTFYPLMSHYYNNPVINDEARLAIKATAQRGNAEYTLSITNDNTEGQTDHYVNLQLMYYPENLPNNQIQLVNLCQTENEPTSVDISKISDSAVNMLNSMNLGQWYAFSCKCEKIPSPTQAYTINITALPVIDNVPVLYQPQLSSLCYSEDERHPCVSTTYFSMATMSFAPDGTILSCKIACPLDKAETDENFSITTLGADELKAKAYEYLKSMNCHNIINKDIRYIDPDSSAECKLEVDITDIRSGYTRINSPTNMFEYYYVPALELLGDCRCFVGGEPYDMGPSSGNPYVIVMINAIDGTIIPTM